jgi:hypothetical protein
MSASENQLPFTRAARKAVACQHLLPVTPSYDQDLAARRVVLLAGGMGAMHSPFEEDYHV